MRANCGGKLQAALHPRELRLQVVAAGRPVRDKPADMRQQSAGDAEKNHQQHAFHRREATVVARDGALANSGSINCR